MQLILWKVSTNEFMNVRGSQLHARSCDGDLAARSPSVCIGRRCMKSHSSASLSVCENRILWSGRHAEREIVERRRARTCSAVPLLCFCLSQGWSLLEDSGALGLGGQGRSVFPGRDYCYIYLSNPLWGSWWSWLKVPCLHVSCYMLIAVHKSDEPVISSDGFWLIGVSF